MHADCAMMANPNPRTASRLGTTFASPHTKGPGADSEEKREPASDIDTAAVDSLKVLDGRLEKRTSIDRRAGRPDNRQAGDSDPLASSWFSSLLALEITTEWRSAEDTP